MYPLEPECIFGRVFRDLGWGFQPHSISKSIQHLTQNCDAEQDLKTLTHERGAASQKPNCKEKLQIIAMS